MSVGFCLHCFELLPEGAELCKNCREILLQRCAEESAEPTPRPPTLNEELTAFRQTLGSLWSSAVDYVLDRPALYIGALVFILAGIFILAYQEAKRWEQFKKDQRPNTVGNATTKGNTGDETTQALSACTT